MVKLAYTYDEAAAATGFGRRAIQDAVRRSDLIASYEGTKPVILADELERWLRSRPHEPVRRAS